MYRNRLNLLVANLIPKVVMPILLLGSPATGICDPLAKLRLAFWGNANDRSCDSTASIVMSVGAVTDVVVTILPTGTLATDAEYTGISFWNWPDGLVIEAGEVQNDGEAVIPSSSIHDQLEFRYYVTPLQAQWDSLWHATGEPPFILSRAPEYHISMSAKAGLAGSMLGITAHWNHPQYGYLEAEEPLYVKITLPCSESAQYRVWTTQVVAATDQRDYSRAIMLADSFITRGWHNLRGLLWARIAAEQIGNYDKAIFFIDICYEENHTIDFAKRGIIAVTPTDEDRRTYEITRTMLVERKTNQQQQR